MAAEYTKPDVNNFKLSFRIHKVTSQDENFPVTELLISDLSNFNYKVSRFVWLTNLVTYKHIQEDGIVRDFARTLRSLSLGSLVECIWKT